MFADDLLRACLIIVNGISEAYRSKKSRLWGRPTSSNVISLAKLFTFAVRAYGALIAKLVYTFCLCAVTSVIVLERRFELSFPQGLTDWLSLDVDLIVKASSGTLLGDRSKDSIMGITRNQFPF